MGILRRLAPDRWRSSTTAPCRAGHLAGCRLLAAVLFLGALHPPVCGQPSTYVLDTFEYEGIQATTNALREFGDALADNGQNDTAVFGIGSGTITISGSFTNLGADNEIFQINGTDVITINGGDIEGSFDGDPVLAGITKTGPGTLILNANTVRFGSLTVNAGTLSLGAIHSGNVQVNTGTALTGDSTVNGNVTVDAGALLTGAPTVQTSLNNSGRVAIAGDGGIGTLNAMNYSNVAGTASLELDVMSAMAHDQLVVGGNATLNNQGTLLVTNRAADDSVLAGQTLTLVDGPLTGTFGTLTLTGFTNVTGQLSYTANSVLLTFAGLNQAPTAGSLTTFLSGVTQSPNQVGLGQALVNVLASGTAGTSFVNDLVTPLVNLGTGDRAAAALQELSPESHALATDATLSVNAGILGAALQGGGLGGGGGVGAQGGLTSAAASSPLQAAGGVTANAFLPFDQMLQSAIYGSPGRVDRGGDGKDDQVWALGFGSWGRQSSTATTLGSSHDGGGVVLGRTWKASDTLRWGIHGGYAESHVDTTGSRNNSEIDTYNVGLHGSHVKDDLYVDAAVGHARSGIDSQRFLTFTGTETIARGDHDSEETYAYTEVGKVYDLGDGGDWFFQPQLALQYQRIEEEAFTETGAGAANLTVNRNTLDLFQTAPGARVFKTCKLDGGGLLVPDLRVRWGHQHGDVSRDVAAGFVGTSQVFQVNGRQQDRDTVQVRAGVTGYSIRNLDFDLGYYGEFAGGQQNNAAVLRVVRSW